MAMRRINNRLVSHTVMTSEKKKNNNNNGVDVFVACM